MKYNEKYDLYLDDDLVIYYWDKNKDKLMQRTMSDNGNGYLRVNTKIGKQFVHRIIYETFVGPIPSGMELDHEDTNKYNNRLDNLKLVTHKENCNNSRTRKHNSDAKKGKPTSEFGRKFKEHYCITRYQNLKLYHREQKWYHRHNNKCRWE